MCTDAASNSHGDGGNVHDTFGVSLGRGPVTYQWSLSRAGGLDGRCHLSDTCQVIALQQREVCGGGRGVGIGGCEGSEFAM